MAAAKDQSYSLYGLTQEELSSTLFPVGEPTKAEVRERAREAGLVTHATPESQDICFISDAVKQFVERQGVERVPGKIVTTSGVEVGSHDGVHSYTVGQRKGLHLGGNDEPLYIVELRPEESVVVVGSKSELESESFHLDDVTLVNPELLGVAAEKEEIEFDAVAQLRHRHRGVPVRVRYRREGTALVTFTDGWTTVTPGQAGVLYALKNEEVLGGGAIRREARKAAQSLAVLN